MKRNSPGNLLFLAGFLLFCTGLFAQGSIVPGGFRHITVREGLPSSEVYKIIQDRDGYLWMSTDAGVCRYNGYSFESFTTRDGLSSNTVFRLREDHHGRIWAQGFSGALNYFDGTRFAGIGANDSLEVIYSYGQKLPYCMETDAAGGVTVGGLYTEGCFRVGPEDQYKTPHRINAPVEANAFRGAWTTPEGNVLAFGATITTDEVGRFFHNGHKIDIPFPEPAGSPTNNRMLLTRENTLIYTYANYLFEIRADGTWESHDFSSFIISVDEDRDGNLWVSTYYSGVWMCPGGDLKAPRKYFFPGKAISGVFEDRENGYWFATIGQGVYYLPNLQIGYLTELDGLPEANVLALAPCGKHSVMLGLPHSKVVSFNPSLLGAPRMLYRQTEPDNPYPVEVLQTLGTVDTVVLSNFGLHLMDSSLNTLLQTENGKHYKGVARNPKDGKLMFFSHQSLDWYDEKFALDSFQMTKVRFTAASYGSDGTLWLGALNGLWKFNGKAPVYMGDSVGLRTRIDAMIEDSAGILWLATRGDGVFAVKGKRVWRFGVEDGMGGNTCRVLTIDESRRIWVGTNRGLTVISGFDTVTGKATLRAYNSTHGLLSDEVKSLLCHDGILWMGTNEGLCWIPMDQLARDSVPPPIYITGVLWGKDTCATAAAGEFRYGGKTIRIFVEGLCFRDPAGLRYKYRLMGGDEQWITTANREISFTGLAPGDYRLEIVAVNRDGTESAKPAVFMFRILAPFWRTWWFILAGFLVLMLVAWLTAGYRSKRLQKRAQEKAQTERRIAELRLSALRAQMNPHFIFNAINSIQHFVLQNDSEQAYNYLAKFSRLIRLVLDQSQAETIPLEQELQMLNLYIELEQLRFERPFSYTIHVDPLLTEENIRIPGMLVQPFVENAIWHGLLPKKEGQALIRISFTKKGKDIAIEIEDNGVGRKLSEQSKVDGTKRRSYGLQITEERLRLSESDNSGQPLINITDLKSPDGRPAGTRVSIHLSHAAASEHDD